MNCAHFTAAEVCLWCGVNHIIKFHRFEYTVFFFGNILGFWGKPYLETLVISEQEIGCVGEYIKHRWDFQ
jgi:hypothetical protein